MARSYVAYVWILLMASCTLFQGCAWLTPRKRAPIRVVDAETGQPIANAKVNAECWTPMSFGPLPFPSAGVTDESGDTELRLAPLEGGGWDFVTSAEGYLEQRNAIDDRLLLLQEEKPWGTTVRLYRKPVPKVTIVVPKGYRGPILIDSVRRNDFIQSKPGQRHFTFSADERGYVGIPATPLLRQYSRSENYAFVEAETGKEIERVGKNEQENLVRARYVSEQPEHQTIPNSRLLKRTPRTVFAVGTRVDRVIVENHVDDFINKEPSHIRDSDKGL